MFIFIGLGVVLACVFGSFVASGGAIGPLLASMPFELLTILGAAVGTFLMANSIAALKHVPGGLKKAMKGSRYSRTDYLQLLSLMFHFTKLAASKGVMALEPHIEDPESSTIFGQFPQIRDNKRVSSFICDYLRMVGMNATDPYQIDDVMGAELKRIFARKCIFLMHSSLYLMLCLLWELLLPFWVSSRQWRQSASLPLFWVK